MQFDRGVLLALIGVLLLLSVVMVLPYLQFVVGAAVLAFVLGPVQHRLSDRIGETISAIVLTLGSLVAVVLPFVLVTAFVAGDAVDFAEDLQDYQPDDAIESWIYEQTGEVVDVQAAVQSVGQNLVDGAAGSLVDVFGTVTHFLIGAGLFAFLLFFLVRDGVRLAAWLRHVAPFPDHVTDDLFERLVGTTWAVLAGHVLVAIVQGVLAGIGLLVVGVPNTAFWTFVMVILALIPLIGTFAVWGPAALYLVAQGRTVAAVGLTIYGTIVVGVSDDYVRPVVVDRYAQVSPAVIIVGVIGGLSAYGVMGLFVGPIVVAALRQTVEVYAKYYGREAEPVDA